MRQHLVGREVLREPLGKVLIEDEQEDAEQERQEHPDRSRANTEEECPLRLPRVLHGHVPLDGLLIRSEQRQREQAVPEDRGG